MISIRKIFKNQHLTTFETKDEVIFSFVLNGYLSFINQTDGLGFTCLTKGIEVHIEYDIEIDVPQNNDFAKGWPYIQTLSFSSFQKKTEISPNKSIIHRIDFEKNVFSFLYAIKFEDSKKILVVNQKSADAIIKKYHDLKIADFISKTLELIK